VLAFRLLVLLVFRAGGWPRAFFTALRVVATAFAATFFFAGFAATFFFTGFPVEGFAAGFVLPLAGARAADLVLLAARVLAAEEAGLVFAEALALLAGRFAAGM
jgi:hypothetical protein